MKNQVQKYMEIFTRAKGNSLAKIKYIMTQYFQNWDWVGSESIMMDLLDDKNITADDVLEFLQGSVELEEGNREFKAAVMAIDVCLKKLNKIHQVKNMKVEDMTYDEDNAATIDYMAFNNDLSYAQAS